MADISLSDAEKTFIVHGVQDDFRTDGRTRRDYRPMEIETDIVSHTSGSARLRLANSDILVGVKTEIDTPFADHHDEGKIEFFVDCSANATPEFEGKGGESLALEIANALQKAYASHRAFDLRDLCILKYHQCWKLYVDILILECGGNLFDAVSLAVKAALFNTKIPKVSAVQEDGGNVELELSDDIHDCTRLSIERVPLLVTLCKIGDHSVVDPSAEEEECASAQLVVGISYSESTDEGFVTMMRTLGAGSFLHTTLKETIKLGVMAGECLNVELLKVLRQEERLGKSSKDVYGFLK
ncbi:exosome complex component RRP42 [Lutzomyia longipalpis]|uniref:exosome complex component RRP42 n=1 Tax=Lutzomyia longipalpis TaxID=7200 RepID=UPI0024841507|nr:exosome complex component RRP42 [Lutzomyia longipalpis]XP_055686603.1 exosome complex component RRP42 [Lutzomyia longipalpis]